MCARDPLWSREWLGEGDKGIGKRMPENEQYMNKQLQTVSKWKKNGGNTQGRRRRVREGAE